jgi:HPt (histidine-containing phosphotransfer) domain-containing protein
MEEFERRMAVLRERFVERARADAAALQEAAADGDRVALRQLAHGLAGNAGLFGHAELGQAAKALEIALDQPGSAEGWRKPLDEVLALIPQ